jgi:hypothetical protein
MPKGVPPLALFRTIAVNEPVFLRVMAGGLLDRGSISLREREIVIDRTCARCGSEYEWVCEARVGDPLWAALRVEWTEEQVIELIALAGFYHLISFVTGALRISPEPYGTRFPRMGGPDAAGDGRSHPASPSGAG